MANPQQPELRRSERVPALEPDATEARLSAERRPGTSEPEGPVPADQRPGHHPDDEQDKPDADAFAERLGVVPDGEEPDDAPDVTGSSGGATTARRLAWSPIGMLLLGPLTGFLAAKAALRVIRRLRD